MSSHQNDRRGFLKITGSSLFTGALYPWLCYGQKMRQPGAERASGENVAVESSALLQERRTGEPSALLLKYHNCCTAVLASFAGEWGVDEELVIRLTRGMPGIGLLGHVCGAVSGATLAIGLATTNGANILDEKARDKTYETVREFVARFEERHGSIECRELIGKDISTPARLEAARRDDTFANCPDYVKSAVTLLDDILARLKAK